MPPLEIQKLFFDDLVEGMEFESPGRTITESDIVAFAGLSGDYNQLHVDSEFAARTTHGERIAHGLLVLAITSGLSTRVVLMTGLAEQIIGLLNLECRFKQATKIGDTIQVRLRITELRATSKGDSGVMTLSRDAINQHGTVVMESVWKLLVRSRQGGEQ